MTKLKLIHYYVENKNYIPYHFFAKMYFNAIPEGDSMVTDEGEYIQEEIIRDTYENFLVSNLSYFDFKKQFPVEV